MDYFKCSHRRKISASLVLIQCASICLSLYVLIPLSPSALRSSCRGLYIHLTSKRHPFQSWEENQSLLRLRQEGHPKYKSTKSTHVEWFLVRKGVAESSFLSNKPHDMVPHTAASSLMYTNEPSRWHHFLSRCSALTAKPRDKNLQVKKNEALPWFRSNSNVGWC